MTGLGKCGNCWRAGAEREGCECINDDFYALIMAEGDCCLTRSPCECVCTSKSGPHSDRLCGRAATTMVALHAWGCCDEPDPEAPEAMDADGNLCVLMCGPCARHAVQRAAANVRRLAAQLPKGAVLECPTCGRPTTKTEHLAELRPM